MKKFPNKTRMRQFFKDERPLFLILIIFAALLSFFIIAIARYHEPAGQAIIYLAALHGFWIVLSGYLKKREVGNLGTRFILDEIIFLGLQAVIIYTTGGAGSDIRLPLLMLVVISAPFYYPLIYSVINLTSVIILNFIFYYYFGVLGVGEELIHALADGGMFMYVFLAIVGILTSLRKQIFVANEAEWKYRALIDSSPFCTKWFNEKGSLVFINKAGMEEHFLKTSDDALKWDYIDSIEPEFKELVKQKVEAALKGEMAELEFKHTPGKSAHEWCHGWFAPLKDDAGKLRGVLFSSIDATERKRLEAELKKYTKGLEELVQKRTADLQKTLKEAEKLAAIIENGFEGVIVTDQRGLIQYVNPAWEKITGWKAEEVVNIAKPGILKSGRQDEAFYKKMWETIIQGRPFSAEIVNKRKDGSFYDVEVVVFPLKLGDEPVLIEISRDISERKKLDEAKTSFISIASHQLRTPLSSTRWITEMLLNGDLGSLTKEQKSFIKDIGVSNQRLINLVNALLASTRLEAGRVVIEPVPLNLLKSTNQILETLRGLIDAKQLKVTLNSVPPSIPTINLEPEAFRQVVLNLISNAINYMANGGTITINLELKDDHVLFSVKDTGIGIAKKDQPRIFEKFFRADNAVSFMPDGTGLGLSLAKALILSWKGRIWFESEEGRGTTFFFTIPLAGMEAKKGEVGLTT